MIPPHISPLHAAAAVSTVCETAAAWCRVVEPHNGGPYAAGPRGNVHTFRSPRGLSKSQSPNPEPDCFNELFDVARNGNKPLVVVFVGQPGDEHVWTVGQIVSHYSGTERSGSSPDEAASFPCPQHLHQQPCSNEEYLKNKEIQEAFQNANFVVVGYIPLDAVNQSSRPLGRSLNPYPFPLIVDPHSKLTALLGALDPLGGGRYPLSSIMLLDPGTEPCSGSRASFDHRAFYRKRLFLPISPTPLFTPSSGPCPRSMRRNSIMSPEELETVVVASLVYLKREKTCINM